MRALVTGASGFVGKHLVARLHEFGWDVMACSGPHDLSAGPSTSLGMTEVDLGDADTLRGALDVAHPDVVFHLAAQASVAGAHESPVSTYETNILGTAHLVEAIASYQRDVRATPRLVFASSAEVYGPREAHEFPLRESLTPNPVNPYSVSKAAGESLLGVAARTYGIDTVIVRTFNLIGPGQSDRFAAASFALQLARIAAGGDKTMLVGNLDAKRDFLDVRDAVKAYVALAGLPSSTPRSARASFDTPHFHAAAQDDIADAAQDDNSVFNVCSGTAASLKDVLSELIRIAHVPVEVREDPARMRPSDTPIYYGSNEKLREATGWKPEISFRQTLQDVYEDARSRMQR